MVCVKLAAFSSSETLFRLSPALPSPLMANAPTATAAAMPAAPTARILPRTPRPRPVATGVFSVMALLASALWNGLDTRGTHVVLWTPRISAACAPWRIDPVRIGLWAQQTHALQE